MGKNQDETVAAGTAMFAGDAPRGPDAVDDAVDRIMDIGTLPQVAMRVLKVANNDEAGTAELHQIVRTDPPLSARLIRCVNSAAFGLRHPIRDLQHAVTYLGFKEVRNLALTACVADVFKTDDQIGPYSRTGLWRHMVSVAVCARMIAARRKMPQFEEAFLAGLLHDIGIILEDQCFHAQFVTMLENLEPNKKLVDVEREHFGFDHTVLGHRLGERWHFTEPALGAIRIHHSMDQCEGEDGETIACVDLANFICTVCGTTSVGLPLVDPPHRALAILGIGRDDVKVIAEDLDGELAQNQHLFVV